MSQIDFSAVGRQYAEDVVNGTVLACKWVQLACTRQLSELEKQSDPAYPFRYDEDKAARVCEFISRLVHIKGPLTGTRIRLEPWQVFILTTIFGWVSKETGFRRYRRVYIEVPRGNAKSTLSSGVALYMLAADHEGGAEVYSAARVKEQAQIVFDDAKKMVRHEASAMLRKQLGIVALEHSIAQAQSGSMFKALASDSQSLDGKATHFACLDELHAHSDRSVFDVMDTSTGKRTQAILWCITTAGGNRSGVCYADVRDRVTKILDGVFDDPSYFGIIYTIDDEDDWTTEAAARKANPNYGVSVFADDLAQKRLKATQQTSAQEAYKTKHLNIWLSADNAWMDMQRFLKCADAKLIEDDFKGEPAVIGLDLASKLDLAAMLRIYVKFVGVKKHYYAFGTYWTPEKRIEASTNSQYKGWALSGYLEKCEGETNDYDLIEDTIRQTCKTRTVLDVAHDPYGAVELVNHLMKEGIVCTEIPQQPKHLTEAMKELEAAVYDGRFHYNGDPILTWAMSNVVCHPDKNENLFPNKQHAESKIDPVSALVTGLNRVVALSAANQLVPRVRSYITVF